MARAPRISIPGAWYHVTARGNERRAIFRTEADYTHMVFLLEGLVGRFGLSLHGYVLMPNHYHLVIEPGSDNLSRAMQWLNTSYSTWFNRRHRRIGHLFQGRFKAIIVDPQEWGLILSRYVHLNPLRTRSHSLSKSQRQALPTGKQKGATAAQIKTRLLFLNSFRWSSYRAFAGFEPVPSWLETAGVATLIEGDPRRWRTKYRAIVEEGAREGSASPWPALEAQIVLGGHSLVEEVKTQIKHGRREIIGKRSARTLYKFEDAVAIIQRHTGRPWIETMNRRGDPSREMVWWLARRYTGLTLSQLGEKAGPTDYAAVGIALKRFENRMNSDPKILKQMKTLERQMLNVEI